jgi:alpha,alpha-trehalose-phosphate synthase [UDP-forming]
VNLVVISNRLPFVAARRGAGWVVEPGSGGLVTALRPLLGDRGGRWIGWTGVADDEMPGAAEALTRTQRSSGYELVPVTLTAPERQGYYYGLSNEVLWPLFHDLLPHCRFDPAYWAIYESVNRKFAEVAAQGARPDDFLWVHDYHLLLMARELRHMGVRSRMAFFLHVPFPPLDIFLKVPWRFEILRALLDFDLVGFQTVRDQRNFLQCVRLLFKGCRVSGKGPIVTVRLEAREVRVGAFPISIDHASFEQRAAEPEVLAKAASLRGDEPGRKIVLGIDRLDYTKGIVEKLEAFRTLIARCPDLHGRITLFQVVVPSREDLPRYREYRTEIERLVGEINGRYTRSGWVPVHYIYRALEGPRLPAYYLAADVALVTPLKDGMNLVAKEYCATRVGNDGALVLSEFAGAAAQLQVGAFLVNPFDVEGVAAALERAVRLTPALQRRRMRRLRRAVQEADIHGWVDSILRAAVSRDLSDFPRVEDYLPLPERARL